MKTLGITESVCPACRRIVPAKVISDGTDVFFEKFCREHGTTRNLIRRDLDDYLRTLRYVKPAWVPQSFAGQASAACPEGCGFCQRHEQHLCMPIIEITSRCDLACPVCLVDTGGREAGSQGDVADRDVCPTGMADRNVCPTTETPTLRPQDMTAADFRRVLDGLLAAERQIDILNLSGGEPLLHPQLLALIDEALARPEIVRVSISTNGLALLRDARLLAQLQERNVVISLQFDGFRPEIYTTLRGRPLLAEKLRLLDLLRDSGITTSLTVTAAAGVNDDQFPQILDYFFRQPHVVSLMIQPLAFAGRGVQLANAAGRLTLPDVVRLLAEAGVPGVRGDDFLPLPCSHPLCFSLAFFLILDSGGMVSLNRLLDASQWLDALANRTVFGLDEGEHQRLKDMIYSIWSGPVATAPDGQRVMHTLRRILDEMAARQFSPRQAFALTERRVKSIFIHAFQDAETFDLARVRRCCNAYPQPDGRLLPACVHNVLGRFD